MTSTPQRANPALTDGQIGLIRQIAETGLSIGGEYATFTGDNLRAIAELCARALTSPVRGDVVVTTDSAGVCVAVTRQDDEGKMLSVIWEAPAPGEGEQVEAYVLLGPAGWDGYRELALKDDMKRERVLATGFAWHPLHLRAALPAATYKCGYCHAAIEVNAPTCFECGKGTHRYAPIRI